MQTGERYGRLTVISLNGSKAICRCDCGNEVSVFRSNLTSGRTKSCGCLRIKHILPGERFGMLTVLSIEANNKVRCRCDCGNEVSVFRHNLLTGHSRSCGFHRKKHSIKPDDRFGILTVLSEQKGGKVLCRCDCGNTISVFRGNLTAGNTKSCGCQQNIKKYKPGDRFGMLTVLDTEADGKVLCRCDCGNEVSVFRSNLSSGNTRSCGCLRKKHVISPGDRFGMLTVISLDGSKATCRCDCGKTVTVFRYNLLFGNTKSCGCQRNKTEFHLKPGDRFGMLTILSDQNSRNILCRCDCGNEVSVRRYSLTSGNTRSCGCQRGNKKKCTRRI